MPSLRALFAVDRRSPKILSISSRRAGSPSSALWCPRRPPRAAFRAHLAPVGRPAAARSPEQSRSAHHAAHDRSSARKETCSVAGLLFRGLLARCSGAVCRACCERGPPVRGVSVWGGGEGRKLAPSSRRDAPADGPNGRRWLSSPPRRAYRGARRG